MTLSQAYYNLRSALLHIYDEGEATAITHEYLFCLTGKDKLQRLMDKDVLLSAAEQQAFDNALPRLQAGEPLQYVTGLAHFLGCNYTVNQHVLIPRPETEELVQWVIEDFDQSTASNLTILDIGTGSGCIPISLKLAMPHASVTSCDISEEALEVAKINAQKFNADIHFLHLDFLNQDGWGQLPKYDIIISNPPYIPIAEKESLERNVRDYEPGTALFVPNEDPLLFYKHIAVFGSSHLINNGAIYCELHRDYAINTEHMLLKSGFSSVLKEDMHGAPRMVRAKM